MIQYNVSMVSKVAGRKVSMQFSVRTVNLGYKITTRPDQYKQVLVK